MSSGGNCPPGNYCEYYFDNGQWHNIWAEPPTGYYCPSTPGVTGSPGQYYCTPGKKVGSAAAGALESAEVSLDGLSPDSVCEYEFRDGQFFLTGASCPAGCFCPPDPTQYVSDHGAVDMRWSKEDGRIIVRMSPVSIDNIA